MCIYAHTILSLFLKFKTSHKNFFFYFCESRKGSAHTMNSDTVTKKKRPQLLNIKIERVKKGKIIIIKMQGTFSFVKNINAIMDPQYVPHWSHHVYGGINALHNWRKKIFANAIFNDAHRTKEATEKNCGFVLLSLFPHGIFFFVCCWNNAFYLCEDDTPPSGWRVGSKKRNSTDVLDIVLHYFGFYILLIHFYYMRWNR